MKMTSGIRGRAAVTIAAGAMAMVALLGSPAAASPLFCGASRGPTAEVAVWGAIDDARNSAQSMGFYGECTLAEPPQIWEIFNDPRFGHFFRASVQVICEE